MYKEKVGSVTLDEKNEIKTIFERKVALNELLASFGNLALDEEEKNKLYEKIIGDIGKTKINLDNWWNEKSQKYKWKSVENGQWNIDFENNDIYLIFTRKAI